MTIWMNNHIQLNFNDKSNPKIIKIHGDLMQTILT